MRRPATASTRSARTWSAPARPACRCATGRTTWTRWPASPLTSPTWSTRTTSRAPSAAAPRSGIRPGQPGRADRRRRGLRRIHRRPRRHHLPAAGRVRAGRRAAHLLQDPRPSRTARRLPHCRAPRHRARHARTVRVSVPSQRGLRLLHSALRPTPGRPPAESRTGTGSP